MNLNRIHDRASFFKHTSASTAKIILAGSKLRWSSPAIFNDPFDVPRNIFEGVDEGRLRDALVDRANELVKHPFLPHPQHHSLLTRTLLQVFAKASPELREQLIAANQESRTDPAIVTTGIGLIRAQWEMMHSEQRILCFTERWNSASMWDRYSDGHRGVLLEFGCLDDLDSAWLLAKPVRYTDEPIRINSTEGFAELMFYTPEYATEQMMETFTHTKTTDWEYEKEWRIASWKRPHESGDCSDYEFAPSELISITFGDQIADEDREALTLMRDSQYPNSRLWKASAQSGRQLQRSEIQ